MTGAPLEVPKKNPRMQILKKVISRPEAGCNRLVAEGMDFAEAMPPVLV
jgi:hypothetical protein